MTHSKLIVVSNRLPISVSKTDGKLTFKESPGGLATAMSSLGEDRDMIWIGWPGIASDNLTSADKRAINRRLKAGGYVPVYLTAKQVADFYDGYSNDTLWPLFHYFESIANHNSEYWSGYQDVNQKFLRAVLAHATQSDAIWIQDYHLMLLPNLIRKNLPEATVGFFLHIPFPSFELFRLLPERKEILEGLLGADLLGFHIYDYARHFIGSSVRLLGAKSSNGLINYNGQQTQVDSFPIGIDYKKFATMATSENTKSEAAILHEHHPDQKVMLSVDRLDYTKGILQRLEAFDVFLKTYPRYYKKVCLVMVAVPSRIDVETYQNLRDQVEQSVSRINGEHGMIDWTPISYQFQNLPFDQLVALYAEADIALVTPLRDGMNLVAKEYVASKQTKPGVLILSEMAGAIDEMPEALSVNPNDTGSIVKAIKTALDMTQREQKTRLRQIQKRISRYTVQRWGADFLDQLQLVKDTQAMGDAKNITQSVETDIKNAFAHADSRTLFLDYDGTLKSFTSSLRQSDSAPSKKLLHLLDSLCNLPNTIVYIVSGRDKASLEKWFGNTKLSLIAEHGAWKKVENSWVKTDANFDTIKATLRPILKQYAERTPGAIVEEKDFSFVWHYRDVPTELAYIRTMNLKHALQPIIKDSDVSMYDGNKILEVKLRNITKGHAVATVLDQAPAEFVLSIGDDFTDEDMFKSLPDSAVTIHVGSDKSHARYQLSNVAQVHSFISHLSMAKK